MVMESQMVSVEGAVAVAVDSADREVAGAREATALEGGGEGDGGEEGEGMMETTRRTEEEEEEEGLSPEEAVAVAAGEGEVVNALTMGAARREGEEGEEEEGGTARSQAEETKMVREMRERERGRQTDSL